MVKFAEWLRDRCEEGAVLLYYGHLLTDPPRWRIQRNAISIISGGKLYWLLKPGQNERNRVLRMRKNVTALIDYGR
jgi:hypothetical protein